MWPLSGQRALNQSNREEDSKEASRRRINGAMISSLMCSCHLGGDYYFSSEQQGQGPVHLLCSSVSKAVKLYGQ